MDGLTISQVAIRSNVHIETIRYYERRGLISKPPRSESGYRMFSHEAVEDIQFIWQAFYYGEGIDITGKNLTGDTLSFITPSDFTKSNEFVYVTSFTAVHN